MIQLPLDWLADPVSSVTSAFLWGFWLLIPDKDQKVAELNIFENKELISTHDVLAMHEVKKVNIISRIIRSFNYLIWGDV